MLRQRPILRAFATYISLRLPEPRKPYFFRNALNYVNYVNAVDAPVQGLEKIPHQVLAAELMASIETRPELLALLLLLHYEFYVLGITPTSPKTVTPAQLRAYVWAYVWKLSKINSVFWEQCYLMDIAHHPHKLGILPANIGVLDPANFSQEHYNSLQSGVYKGLDFRDNPIMGTSWKKRKPVPES